jgi:hypothetical protein
MPKEGFAVGFLVLGFVIFIVGFLTGMLAFAMISVKPDMTALGFMIFTLGFVTGLLTIALLLVLMKLSKLTEKSS